MGRFWESSKSAQASGTRRSSGARGTASDRRKRAPAGNRKVSARPHGIRDRPARQDYRKYRLSPGEWARCAAIYLGLDAAVSCLFFDSVPAFLLLLPGFPFFVREYRRGLKEKRDREMRREFLDGMQMTAACLQAGYSVENAFRESLKELQKIYGRETFIMREFRLLSVQIDMNRSIEELLSDLGQRSGIDDIRSLAEIVETAKRTGGDLIVIIRNTISCMRQRQETLAEIETSLSGKAMEQNVMSVVPILILAYVRLSSPEFLESMYGTVTGIAVMGVCLAVYLAGVLWGRSIVRIEV